MNYFNQKRATEPYLNIVPSIIWKGSRWRVIWNKLHYRPITETFHEFILYVLKLTLGEDWYKNQIALKQEERHVVIKWFESYIEWRRIIRIDENKVDDLYRAIPTGEVQSLISLAYDIYCLQQVNKLPDFLTNKIKNKKQFQGVRYEIAVAAIIARTGFDITFLDDVVKSKKHCEFIAKHKKTEIEIGVEAKSRHRKGILHEEGEFNYATGVRGDVQNLFKKAISQKPLNMPYIIFIDLNLPASPHIDWNKKPWVADIKTMLDNYGTPLEENPDPFNALILSNFSSYYGGNNGVAPQMECMIIVSPYPDVCLKDSQVLNEIWKSLKRYSDIPREV